MHRYSPNCDLSHKKKKEGKNEKKDIKYSTMGCCLSELD